MAAVFKITYAMEVKANHMVTYEAMWRGLIHCLNGLMERALTRSLTDRWEGIRQAKDIFTNALRGRYDRATVHAISCEELDSATEEEEESETEGGRMAELEMDKGLEVEVMPDCFSS